MNGILVVNKPKNFTSRDIVNKLNNIFHEKKIGHTGTLDPIATGVLVICIGKYTKLVDLLTSFDKEYIAEMKIGIKTDTQDITGNIIETSDPELTISEVEKVFNNFPNTYEQVVPKYSAVKVNGKKLYEYARNNENIVLPTRIVSIYSLELISFEKDIIKFKTRVSKGTYIRQLIEDIAKELNTIATMYSLNRVKQGDFNIDNSYTLKDIENGNYKLLEVSDVFSYPSLEVTDETRNLFENGNKVKLDTSDGKYFVKDHNTIIAIYEFIDKVGHILIRL